MAFCGFYIDLFDILVIVETNTGGHGITEYGLSVIDIEFDQSRNVEEEWRCILVFVIKIYKYIYRLYICKYILVCFLFGLHGSHSSTINQYQYQIGSVFSFRAEQIRRVQSINQSISGVALEVASHRLQLQYTLLFC